MLLMTLCIVAVLLTGFLLMSTNQVNHLNRAALAMFCGVTVWVLYILRGGSFLEMMHPEEYTQYLQNHETKGLTVGDFVANNVMVQYISEACSVILFLIATNTIVGVMKNNGVFDSLVSWLRMKNSKQFLWVLSILTYFISANVDNLTTVILMMSIVSQIVNSNRQKVIYSCAILVSASMGGAFTVIGDMPSLMLWVRGVVSASSFAAGLFIPTFVSLCTFTLLLSTMLQGNVSVISFLHRYKGDDSMLRTWQKGVMLFVGIIGLWFIPSFSAITHFSPFIGALCLLSIIWVIEGVFTFKINGNRLFVQRAQLRNTDFIGVQLIIYYLGISLGVGALKECGALDAASQWLTNNISNVYAYGAITGMMSTVFDNVPMVMSGMNMFELDNAVGSTSDFVANGTYWQLLSYCSAIGGCVLYVGTLAGHAVVDVEKITLSWYVKHISWRVIAAWGTGMFAFWMTH